MRAWLSCGGAASVALGLVLACSSSDSGSTPSSDAGDESSPPDAPDTPPPPDDGGTDSSTTRCDPSIPYKAVGETIPGLEAATYAGITLTVDELDAVLFVVGDAGAHSFVEAHRTTTKDPFVLGRTLTELDIGIAERAGLSPDGLTIWFSATLDGGEAIFQATRVSLSSPFGTPAHVSQLDLGQNAVGPYVAHGAFWFSAGTPGAYRIYRATLAAGTPTTPALVAGLDRAGFNFFLPVVADDGLAIYWSGSPNVYRALRDIDTDPFSKYLPVNEIQAPPQFEQASWLSLDRCRLYYARGSGSEIRVLIAHH
jgi:hypothetical protein